MFVALFLRILRKGGRCACIVPDGVLFGSTKAHKSLRKELVEKHQLQAVISLPSGVFKPYAGVSTAILLFTKTGAGGTDKVWFYDMKADGYSLDDKRSPIEANDIPDIIARYHKLEGEADRLPTEQSFLVDKSAIEANVYDLSINRYKEVVYRKVEYDKPEVIMARLDELNLDIVSKMEELRGYWVSKLLDIIEKPLPGEWGSDDDAGKGTPVLRTTNFTNNGTIDYSNVVTRTIDAKKMKEKYLINGDIIIEKSGGSPAQPVGRVVFFEGGIINISLIISHR